MYISKVRLHNVRCCNDLDINFEGQGSSILISGDNGDGKSTVLRAIAMGLCDESSAAGLLRELPGDFVCKGKEEEGASIDIELTGKKNIKYRIVTNITSLTAFERITQQIFINNRPIKGGQEKFPWQEIFVAGYGAGNRLSGASDFQHYVSVDAVYPIFRYDVPLQEPELVFRRVIDAARKTGKENFKLAHSYALNMTKYLTDLLHKLLNLNVSESILLGKSSLEIKSKKWGKHELGVLGDGYKAVTTLVLDLISWWMLYLDKKSLYKNKNIKGIVLIDEVEQHLHPKWQLKIMELLHLSFPFVQFIVTTHSPLVISGSGEIPVLRLNRGNEDPINVRGWLAEDVYREIMGLKTTRSADMYDDIKEYERMHLKNLTMKTSKSDLEKMAQLKKKIINTLPGTDPIILSAELENLMKIKTIKK